MPRTPSPSHSSLTRDSLLRLLDLNLQMDLARPVASTLRQIRASVRSGEIELALRSVDRAWRCHTDDSALLAPLFGRLLVLDARDDHAALRLLQRASDLSPDAEIDALCVLSLLRLDRLEDARRQLARTLVARCVQPGGLLAHAASSFLQHPEAHVPGWVGRGPALEIVGELSAHDAPNALDVRVDGGRIFSQLLPNLRRDAPRTFSFHSPHGSDAHLEIGCHGAALLGSGLRLRADFSLDGRIWHGGHANAGHRGAERRIGGWVRLGWLPSEPRRIRISDTADHHAEPALARHPGLSWQWPFDLDLRGSGLRGERFEVAAELPGGRWQALPDSPLLLKAAVRLRGAAPKPLTTWSAQSSARLRRVAPQANRLIDVIIPVFRGSEATLACIDTVLATVGDSARVVVVDDASGDLDIVTALEALEADGRIQLLRNQRNRGFVASANRGLAQHPNRDAVLLNSDTLVFTDWLARLRSAAYSGPKVGTATPLTNSGTIASYPNPEGGTLEPLDAAVLHGLTGATHPGVSIEIPVGVGFCMYLRRDCLRAVGELDAAVFGRGYGEESDFCLRARRRGWTHRLAADVFVYHRGGLSFGHERSPLLERSQRLLELRHPGYQRFVSSYIKQDPAHSLRRALDVRRLQALEGRFVLLVTLALAGGVERYVAERCQTIRARGLIPLVLRAAGADDRRRCELWTDALQVPSLQYAIPTELTALTTLLAELSIDGIEIQHFLHLDARVIEAVRGLRQPYDVFVHDYSWICPRVTLIDGTGRYCGEPAVSVCRTCVRKNGSQLGEAISVPDLRKRSAAWLAGARQVIAPSADTAARFERHFPGLDLQVRPHTPDIALAELPPHRAARNTLRIALIGGIGTHKGYQVLLECARDARRRRLALEFVVIGHTEKDAPLLATGKVFITGRYRDVEIAHLLLRERPDLVWLPSVWPETWCYALDHALAAGIPVVAFDLGAIAERLKIAGSGELLPLRLSEPKINDRLLELGERVRSSDSSSKRGGKTAVSVDVDDATMRENNGSEQFMAKTSNGKPAQETKEDGLSASVQVLPLPPGLYLFSVKTAKSAVAGAAGQLALPAMHVGLAPGVRSDQVEFMAGPSTHGAWLFCSGDLLVTKVTGTGVSLVLSSIRAPGGEVLAITVERLEDRSAATAAVPAPPPAPVRAPERAPIAARKAKIDHVFPGDAASTPLEVRIGAHIRSRGDMNFTNVPWAGRIAPGLWIESFSIRPLERFVAADIEYKGLTGSGFETPWLSDDKMCGTKGMATPLVGFAIRLKPSPSAAAYDCEYSGYFQSGVMVGPMRNGAPCRSTVANDSLEGIQLRLLKRTAAALPEARKGPPPIAAQQPAPRAVPEKKAAATVTRNNAVRPVRRTATRRS